MIVDASVGVKWLVREADSDVALALLDTHDLAAPDLLKLEVGHVLGKRLRRGQDSRAFVADAWRELQAAKVRFEPFQEHLTMAFALSLELGAALYDCVYLALAETEDDTLVTSDERFAHAARQCGDAVIARRVRLLGDFAP